MKNYTVKEISSLLKINPETVRRWIRNGQLDAVQVSRKDGNLVSEDALKKFVTKMPQYAPLAAGIFALSPISIGVAIATVCTTVLSSAFHKKKRSVTSEYVRETISEKLKNYEQDAEKKKAAIEKLQLELEEDKRHIDEYRYALTHCDFEQMADDINKKL